MSSSTRQGTEDFGSREIVVHLLDRPASLERFFGTIRRRRMALDPLSMSPCGPDRLVILLNLRGDGIELPRWVAELEELEDVVEVRLSGPPPRPGG